MLRINSTLLALCVVMGVSVQTAFGQPGAMLLCLDFSHDSSFLATGGDRVRVYDVKTGKLLREIQLGKLSRSIAFSPSARDLFAVASDDGSLRLWQVGNKEVLRELTGHDGLILSMAFGGGGRYLAATSQRFRAGKTALGQFRLWNVETAKLLQSIDVEGVGMHGVSFSHGGKLVAFCQNRQKESSSVEVYQVRGWEHVATVPFSANKLDGNSSAFGMATLFAEDDRKLFIAGGICVRIGPKSCRTTGLLWHGNLDGGSPAKQFAEPVTGYQRSLSLSPEGKHFATGAGGFIELRDVRKRGVLWKTKVRNPDPYGVTISPDGQFVGVCQANEIRLLETKTGRALRVLPIGN